MIKNKLFIMLFLLYPCLLFAQSEDDVVLYDSVKNKLIYKIYYTDFVGQVYEIIEFSKFKSIKFNDSLAYIVFYGDTFYNHGFKKEFYPNGSLIYKEKYKKGIRNGKFFKREQDDSHNVYGKYKNGKLHGKYKITNTGRTTYKVRYKLGLKVGSGKQNIHQLPKADK